MLIADGRVLAEQRKLTKSLAPGAVALPGGHLEGDEDRKDALERELREELASSPTGSRTSALSCTVRKSSERFITLRSRAGKEKFSTSKPRRYCGWRSTSPIGWISISIG
jgi:NUDIX domain